MGTSVGTHIFVKFGWRASAAFAMGLYGWQFFILLIRGPHCKRYTWFGYEGGLEARKSVVREREQLEQEEKDRQNETPSQQPQDDKREKGESVDLDDKMAVGER